MLLRHSFLRHTNVGAGDRSTHDGGCEMACPWQTAATRPCRFKVHAQLAASGKLPETKAHRRTLMISRLRPLHQKLRDSLGTPLHAARLEDELFAHSLMPGFRKADSPHL